MYNYSIKAVKGGLLAVVKYYISQTQTRVVASEFFGANLAGARKGGLAAARDWCVGEIAERTESNTL